MKKKSIFLTTLFIISVFLNTNLIAEINYKVDFSSRYIWRGFDLNPIKKPVIQPSIDYAFGGSGLFLNIWGSISFENKETNEIDLTLTYTFKTPENISISAGIIHYGMYFVEDFNIKDNTNHEIFVSAGLPNMRLNPSLSIFYDFTNGDGLYVLFKTGYSLKLFKTIGADLSASLGYNGGQWLAEGVDPGFSDLNFGIAIPFNINKFNISPFVNYTIVLLDAIGNENHLWFGVSVGYK